MAKKSKHKNVPSGEWEGPPALSPWINEVNKTKPQSKLGPQFDALKRILRTTDPKLN